MKTKESVRHDRTDLRRRQIIAAALSCFVEYGYANTTMENIRLRSGASNGSIYHHFKGKEQLAAAVYLEGILDYQNGFLAELRKNKQARKGVRSAISYHLDWVSEKPEWARYLLQMGNTNLVSLSEEAIGESNLAFFAEIAVWFETRIEAGDIRRLPIEICLPLLLAPCYEFSRLWLAGLAQSDIASASKMLSDAACAALKAA
jgi:AcrR family transcriptional regulator